MFPLRKTFESDQAQLQELNSRLSQYLSRTKQLEQENARLLAEVNQLRQSRGTGGWERECRAEVSGLRRTLERLSAEKSKAEMEREKVWRELRALRDACGEQKGVTRDVRAELQGCEKELQQAHKVNGELQQRLLQLQNHCKGLEEARRRDMEHLLRQLDPGVGVQISRGPPAVTVEELQDYAHNLSQGWMETFDMYQLKVEEMERAVQEDQARLRDMKAEKMQCVSELSKLRTDSERQAHTQRRLEEQLAQMQDRFRLEFGEYQMIIEELEHERNMLAGAMTEKMREHQHLLQVKMDLGKEVAAYRALLEHEPRGLQDSFKRMNQHSRERIIDIQVPPKAYPLRASALSSSTQRMGIKYTSPSSLSRSPVPLSGSASASRVVPISVTGRARHQSPASRRDMISFNKAQAAAASVPPTLIIKNKHTDSTHTSDIGNVQKAKPKEERVKEKKDYEDRLVRGAANVKSVRGAPLLVKIYDENTETKDPKQLPNNRGVRVQDEFKDKANEESASAPTEKKTLDSVSVEEIIEKVMKPVGLEAKACSSGDSKVTYHVEQSQEDDGRTKTHIVLESKVEEELDISTDSALEELLCQGVKKVSIENMGDTATAAMIKNLISSIQGEEDLQNRTVNVEIIEEPVESCDDEDLETEQKRTSSFHRPSAYFQIEELEDEDADEKSCYSPSDQVRTRSVRVHKTSGDEASPHFSHDQEEGEYFVSTPDDLAESTGGGITSYGHYGIVDDLSDERYYQDERAPQKRVVVEESDDHKYMTQGLLSVKESYPECIIEEEVRVSPDVQESVLEFLREDSLEPEEQIKGALEKLKTSVSGPLREELAFLTKVSSESPQSVAIRKVEQSSDNGTVTVVAELNVSQTLEDSGLLDTDEEFSEEQIMEALRSSNISLGKSFGAGEGGEYSIRVFEESEGGHGGSFEDRDN